ncbi:MAG: Sensor histidine kinase RcsC [Candidatus Omnitrophica bacterium]|nr:Sensor histidine kinase RcsC [Candidatus Omnitrophota bacterium]
MKKLRVVVLEDVQDEVELIESELKKGFRSLKVLCVNHAKAYQEALEIFEPDVVLADYTLEGYSGRDALAFTRRKHRDIPFLFVSWQVHEDAVIDALKAGATDYVFKEHLSRLNLAVYRAVREAEERKELRVVHERTSDEERIRALGQMASGIVHDFSNVLMPIVGYSELLLNHPDSAKDRQTLERYVSAIHTAGQDAMHLVARLREFYRPISKIEPLAAVDLRRVVEEAVLLSRPRWRDQALREGTLITVETELYDLPRIAGNESSLREALTNLIFNAVDALPKGGKISFKAAKEEGYVTLEVRDTGVGMTEEVRRRCLEPFFSTKGRRGTGMGLSMVYGIVRRHAGSIDIKSEPGQGTTFALRFPVYVSDAAGGQTDASEGGAHEPAYGRKLKILVIDDEDQARHVVQEILMTDGHAPDLASTPEAGLDKALKGDHDLVLLDWSMPNLTGDVVAERIRKKRPVPIILLTGYGEEIRSRFKADSSVVDIIIGKPATLESIRRAIRVVMDAAATNEPPPSRQTRAHPAA